ncbi:hypothetical protein PMAYCL1PPCAC_16418, partial [Pristionchus mayeri]
MEETIAYTSSNSLHLLCRTRRNLMHKSLTLLLDMHCFWTLVFNVGWLVNSSMTLHAHISMRKPSDIMVHARTCILRRAPEIMGVYGSLFSQMAMAAERYRASTIL